VLAWSAVLHRGASGQEQFEGLVALPFSRTVLDTHTGLLEDKARLTGHPAAHGRPAICDDPSHSAVSSGTASTMASTTGTHETGPSGSAAPLPNSLLRTTAQNMTVNLVPWPLSPGTNCNMPPIWFASASTIFIPRLLHRAGSNPTGNPGPASKTDNE
jgi:hypothetical protein